jgi:hypothetical protein
MTQSLPRTRSRLTLFRARMSFTMEHPSLPESSFQVNYSVSLTRLRCFQEWRQRWSLQSSRYSRSSSSRTQAPRKIYRAHGLVPAAGGYVSVASTRPQLLDCDFMRGRLQPRTPFRSFSKLLNLYGDRPSSYHEPECPLGGHFVTS